MLIIGVYAQGVSKIFGQTSKMFSSHHNKEKTSYKRMYGNEWFWG
jgi:hypothetical protein